MDRSSTTRLEIAGSIGRICKDFAPRLGFAYADLAEAGYARRIWHLLLEKLLRRQWTRPGIFNIIGVDFIGRRHPRDHAHGPGIPIGTGAGYRELARRPDPGGAEPQRGESVSSRSNHPAVQFWIPIRLCFQRRARRQLCGEPRKTHYARRHELRPVGSERISPWDLR